MNHVIELYTIAYHFLALWSIYSSSLTLIGDLVLGSVSPFPPQHLPPTAHWRASLLFFDFLNCNNLHHFTLVICSYGHILDPGFSTFWDFKIKQLSLWLWFALLRDLWFSNSHFNPKGLFNSIFLYFLPFSPFLSLCTFLSSFLYFRTSWTASTTKWTSWIFWKQKWADSLSTFSLWLYRIVFDTTNI